MTPSDRCDTRAKSAPTTRSTNHALPLFLLAAGLFVFLTAELYPVGAMPNMVATLGASEASVGRLVTWYAVGVGLATVPVVVLTRRLARRTVIVGTLLALAASMVLAAVAPNLTVVALARLVGAAAHGGIFAVVPLAAATLAPAGAAAKYVARAFLGGSVGVVAGPPAVAFISQHAGWRTASALIAALAVLIALASWVTLPPMRADVSHESRLNFRLPVNVRHAFGVICLVTAVIVTAHNAAYAFIAPILADHGVNGTGYALTLLAYGAAGAATTAYASRHLDDRPNAVTVIALGCMAASLLALSLTPGPVLGVIAAVAWGGSFGVLPVAMQTRVLTVSGRYSDSTTPLYVVAFQVGISAGAFLGSLLITRVDALTLPVIAAVATVVATALFVVGVRSGAGRSSSDGISQLPRPTNTQ